MRYQKLVELYEKLSSTTKRLEKIEILSKFLLILSEKDREIMYLLVGDIYPEYDERKIGISNQLAIKAISKATGTEPKQVTREWKSLGDLGKVAEKLTLTKTQSTLHSHVLTTEKVLENLRKLPELGGKGTVGKKLGLITELLTSSSPIEALYLTRTLLSDLRIGLKESTIRSAMAHTFFTEKKNAGEKIQEAIDRSNDIASVFDIAKKGKIKELEKVMLEVGKPIKAMLAQKAKDIEEGFKKVGKPCAIEYKYDGFRMIIHKQGEEIKLFTRSLENVTKQFPEVIEYVKRFVKGKTFILDSEAVGFDSKTKEYQPFQSISQRIRRKYNIKEMQEKFPIEVTVFDVLYYEGKSLLNEPFEKRTALVKKIITNHPYKLIHSKQLITKDKEKAEKFYKEALAASQEGVMMKNLQAKYQPGNRVGHMIKVKPEEKDLDLVISGAEYGTGKRSGWMSSFILSCKGKERFLEIGKMGTGIKEKAEEGISFKELTKKLTPLIEKEEGRSVKIKPKIVISVTYQEIQISPNYKSGFALRFPRLTALRPDRKANDISTLEDIKNDFNKQKRNWRYG
jgi:DNA ligase-1